jgi:uncharacterized protein
MPAGWSKRRDIDPLADGQARFDFEIPLADFVRLRPQLATAGGELAGGSVQFLRDQGFAAAELEVKASVPLVCQRCLGTVRLDVNERSRVLLVGTEAEADRTPAGMDTVLAPERRVSLHDLVEEELLLAVPAVPLHERPEECTGARPEGAAPAQEATVQRPFERLGELLKRDP